MSLCLRYENRPRALEMKILAIVANDALRDIQIRARGKPEFDHTSMESVHVGR